MVVVLLAAAAAAYGLWPQSDDPQSVCVRQAQEDREVAFTGEVTDEQIDDFCTGLLNGEPVHRR